MSAEYGDRYLGERTFYADMARMAEAILAAKKKFGEGKE
jgi:hypothetical protein